VSNSRCQIVVVVVVVVKFSLSNCCCQIVVVKLLLSNSWCRILVVIKFSFLSNSWCQILVVVKFSLLSNSRCCQILVVVKFSLLSNSWCRILVVKLLLSNSRCCQIVVVKFSLSNSRCQILVVKLLASRAFPSIMRDFEGNHLPSPRRAVWWMTTPTTVCAGHGVSMTALSAQGPAPFCRSQWDVSLKNEKEAHQIHGFMGFLWTFIGCSTSAFIVPCPRPRKGQRVRAKGNTVRRLPATPFDSNPLTSTTVSHQCFESNNTFTSML